MGSKENNKPFKHGKKFRCQNWLDEEKTLLLNLVQQYVNIVENKNNDSNTNKRKRDTWQKICNSFNELSINQGPQRTVDQLKTQWSIIKMNRKRKLSQGRNSTLKTGDGTTDGSIEDNNILMWLPEEYAADTNEFDRDTKANINKKPNVNDYASSGEMVAQPPLPPHYFYPAGSEGVPHREWQQGEIDPAQHVEPEMSSAECPLQSKEHDQSGSTSLDNINNVEGQGATLIKGKKKMSQKKRQLKTIATCATAEEAAHHMETLVNFDKKIKQEMHDIQMKNEHIKHEILSIKLEYWKKKAASFGGQDSQPEKSMDSQ